MWYDLCLTCLVAHLNTAAAIFGICYILLQWVTYAAPSLSLPVFPSHPSLLLWCRMMISIRGLRPHTHTLPKTTLSGFNFILLTARPWLFWPTLVLVAFSEDVWPQSSLTTSQPQKNQILSNAPQTNCLTFERISWACFFFTKMYENKRQTSQMYSESDKQR